MSLVMRDQDLTCRFLARANEPLKLSRYQEIFSHDILQAAEGSDSLLALDANNPLLLKEDLAVQKVCLNFLDLRKRGRRRRIDPIGSIPKDQTRLPRTRCQTELCLQYNRR
jgi:hypothetical protein